MIGGRAADAGAGTGELQEEGKLAHTWRVFWLRGSHSNSISRLTMDLQRRCAALGGPALARSMPPLRRLQGVCS